MMERQGTLGDSRRITTKFNVNNNTSSSRSRTPDPSLKINDGRSLTLAEFAERIETESGQVVERMHARFHRRNLRMPVAPPQPNVDRFNVRGNQLVEDIVYQLANRRRLSIHGIIPFFVLYVDVDEGQDVFYHF